MEKVNEEDNFSLKTYKLTGMDLEDLIGMKIKHLVTIGIKFKHLINIKIKKGRLLFVLLMGTLFLNSCDKAYELKMSKCEGLVSLPCGSVTIKTKVMGNQLFFIRQQYELTGELWVNPDSLEIIYKSNNLDFSLWRHDTGNGIKSRTMITGKTTLQLDFNISNFANKGDTIFIVGNGFLNCQDHNVLPDTISIFVDR